MFGGGACHIFEKRYAYHRIMHTDTCNTGNRKGGRLSAENKKSKGRQKG